MPAEQWQAIALADLRAVHTAIIDAHPGYIDPDNPGVRAWSEQGYREAQALIPRVVNYDTMMSAVRYYVSGFQDGHLAYSDNVRSGDFHEIVNGWRVDEQHGKAVVTAVMPGWSDPLPPVGATLQDCDGRTPEAIVAEDQVPYFDRRNSRSLRNGMFPEIGSLRLSGQELKQCTFIRPDGKTIALKVVYRSVRTMDVWKSLRSVGAHSPARRNRYDVVDNVLWIRAANFMPGPDEAKELDVMLKEIAALRDVRSIVFDTRGNAGGESVIGQRIFAAATGGLVFNTTGLDRLPVVFAQWRVSDISISGVAHYVDEMSKRHGPNHARTQETKKLLDKLRDGRHVGNTWVDTAGMPRLTRAEVASRGGWLRRFAGKVAVITDSDCASACLDFVDLIRLVPGSLHLGRTTASDTVYLERAAVPLPSGNVLFMPMKVWRNRVRGDGEALVPHVELNIDFNNDRAVRAAVLDVLR
ncbi:S41 family peptidase [Massilia sp. METH4]|uniref:S41 family peptidase n=1 Tax=Massilia sp. METH4 TaxID=3123041 RepID=UPI0030CBE972